jgi:glycosyltransferase involved in cell wall biosynthesis
VKRQTAKPSSALISICIPSYNYGRYIGDAITSALNQSYSNFEVVVCDNGSTDETFDVLASFREDPRVQIYINGETVSMAQNHNAAIAKAKGEYIVMLAADDILLPHHLTTLMTRMNDPRDPVDIVMGLATYCDARLAPLGTPFTYGMLPVNYSLRDEFVSMIINYSQMFPAKIVPRSIYEKHGGFNESMSISFDVDFALRTEIAGYRTAYVHEIIAGLRMHSESATSTQSQNLVGYHRDKLTYLEALAKDEHAWRFEYIGHIVAQVLEQERAIIPTEKLDRETLNRSLHMATRLRTYADERHTWPANRPRVTVIVNTHGSTKALLATLDALWDQQFHDLEILVVQTQGAGVGNLLQTRPYAHSIRYVQAPHLTNAGGVLKLGIELSRAPYVTYLEEGQTTPSDHIASLVQGIDVNAVDFVFTDASSIQVVHEFTSSGEEGQAMHIPVQRGEILPSADALTFSQMMVRRNLLFGSGLMEHIDKASEQEFIEALKFHYRFVYFERRAVSEFASTTSGK